MSPNKEASETEVVTISKEDIYKEMHQDISMKNSPEHDRSSHEGSVQQMDTDPVIQ